MSMTRVHLPELHVPGKRLGRHVAHDARSLDCPAEMAPAIVTVRHLRRVPIFQQGDLSSCTGNAGIGMMCTDPFGKEDLTEDDAVELYSEATVLDNIHGTYPPNDTGSNGLAIMKALCKRGWIKHYTHAFGLDHALRALVLRPGIVGMKWLEGCDTPDEDGVVSYSGAMRGGHEVELTGLDAKQKLVWFANSWGTEFGIQGYFALTFADFTKALADGGDVTFAR